VTEPDGRPAGFAELHDELRTVARDLLTTAEPPWSLLAASGWTGLEVPEDLEGAGATFAETAVILREMGRAATRSPYLGAAILGAGTLLALQPGAARDDLLRRTAAGRTVPVAVLADGSAATIPLPATGRRAPFWLERTAGGLRLNGRAAFAPDAAQASHLLLLAASADDPAPVICCLAAEAAGLAAEPQPVVDETRRLAIVTADRVPVPETSAWRFAGDPGAGATRLLDRAAVAIACDSLGLMDAMLDRTVAYAKVRHQFGRPIGSFQAVQHACADMLVQVNACRELTEAAVAALAAGAPDGWVAASMAKAHVTAAAVQVAGKAMQLHGGIGYTWESGIHAYLKRATLNRALFGRPAAHRRRLAARYPARYTSE
jgi:alkylation response protein AidB-like acyl-CoA dehydrogenase